VKEISEFILSRLGVGLLAVAPIYLAGLPLLKVMKSFAAIARPLAKLLPKWLPAEHILSLLLVLIVCFLIGLMVRAPTGRATWEQENSLFKRIPGYGLFRSLTQQLTGKAQDRAWKPALAEIEEALVPAFIIEEHEDGRAPSPMCIAHHHSLR
jgi:uncharacterized membrane protein